LDAEDARENEFSLANGFRLLSAYRLRNGVENLGNHRSRPQRHDILAAGGVLNVSVGLVSNLPYLENCDVTQAALRGQRSTCKAALIAAVAAVSTSLLIFYSLGVSSAP